MVVVTHLLPSGNSEDFFYSYHNNKKMVEFNVRNFVEKLRELKKEISVTKYLLGAATMIITFVCLPLIRQILQADGTWSTVATTVYWLAITRCGFSISLYPWWLATAKSLLYYKRLRHISNVIIMMSLILSLCRSVLAPTESHSHEDVKSTTIQFRVVSTLYWTFVLVGTFLIIPVFIRRARLFRTKSPVLYAMVIPFILVMLVSIVVHEWTGNGFYVSYSPFLIMVLFIVAIIAEKVNTAEFKFDESYIMVVGESNLKNLRIHLTRALIQDSQHFGLAVFLENLC